MSVGLDREHFAVQVGIRGTLQDCASYLCVLQIDVEAMVDVSNQIYVFAKAGKSLLIVEIQVLWKVQVIRGKSLLESWVTTFLRD